MIEGGEKSSKSFDFSFFSRDEEWGMTVDGAGDEVLV